MIPHIAGKKWEHKGPKPKRFNPGDIVAPVSHRRKPFREWKLLRVLTCEPSRISDGFAYHFTYYPLVKEDVSENTQGFDFAESYFKLNAAEKKKAMSIYGGYIAGKETGIL
jgi:hypothetical protein